jgi:hypothetical protein
MTSDEKVGYFSASVSINLEATLSIGLIDRFLDGHFQVLHMKALRKTVSYLKGQIPFETMSLIVPSLTTVWLYCRPIVLGFRQ